ncbi:hypothetical protein [Xanthobacter autotrophicus]
MAPKAWTSLNAWQSFEIGGKMEEHRAWASITAKVATLTAEDAGFTRPN